MAGCVVLSLVAIALPTESREPIAGALAPDGRRAARRAPARRRTLAERLGDRANGSSSPQDSVAHARRRSRRRCELENDHLRKLDRARARDSSGALSRPRRSTARRRARIVVTTLTLDRGKHGGDQAVQPGRRAGGPGRHDLQNADPTMSIAILYTHPDFRASAMSADGAAFGSSIRTPIAAAGGDAYMLELRGVPTRVTLKPNTRDLHVGPRRHVPARHHHRHGVAGDQNDRGLDAHVSRASGRDAVARRPRCSCSRLSALPREPATCGARPSNADSATKRIAAAGDSLAKQAAHLCRRRRDRPRSIR